tara:strand:+ start:344 stop:994 length:651 start_codon:yes stop_codon:yes gene_type:complete
MFGIVGFGLNVIQDGTKLGESSITENEGQLNEVTVKSFEMEKSPFGAGGYFFIDLAGWTLEFEGNLVGGEYNFSVINQLSPMENIPFAWGRLSTAITVKKNLADFSIPLLAKTALSAGVGVNSHSSTPRASVSMVKELLGTDDLSTAFDTKVLEEKLIEYLKENKIDNSGFHAQLGLRFKILFLDSHLNFRYNISKGVYEDSDSFSEIQFKVGMGF